MAGYTLLREIRKIDRQLSITIICADSGDFYSKPMLSNALDKNKTPDTLVMQTAAKMVEIQNFELINNTRVTAIDPENKSVNTQQQRWQYDQLILACGAQPVVLPINGDAATDILSVNNLDDYLRFCKQLENAQSVAIIGPGLIGCEFANDLLKANKTVSIIGPDKWPISKLLPQNVGLYLQHKLQQAGVQFHLQSTVKSIRKIDSCYQLLLNDDRELKADLVLSAVGLQLNSELARNSGLKTNKAYLVDKMLRTSDQHIFALGDCAEVEGLHLPFILPIMQAARALAKTLTGTPTAVSYPAMPVAIKTPDCPLVVAHPASQNANWQTSSSDNGMKALCYQDDKLVGFALADDAVSEKQTLTQQLPPLL